MSRSVNLLAGFDDYGRQSNFVFRACLEALSRPGQIAELEPELVVPPPLMANAAAVFLTLADFETTFWLDAPLTAAADVVQFLKFHTGAQQVAECVRADFAIIAEPQRMPDLAAFMQGTPEYPDRSTTLIVQVSALDESGWRFTGPGIKDDVMFRARPLADGFERQLIANRAVFPSGVDLFFTSSREIAALPRSVTLND